MKPLGGVEDKIAVIYCAADRVLAGREQETIADGEDEEVAQAVKAALESFGQPADVLRVRPECLEMLSGYSWIFNLAENVSGDDYLEYHVARGMENLGLHFTGSSAKTLKTCLNKPRTKLKLMQHGLLTPAYTVIHAGETVDSVLSFPLFVKPVQTDGSLGVSANSKVHNRAELEAKVQEIHQIYQQAALVEEFIDGRDISASVLGNGDEMQVLPLSEIIYQPAFEGPRVLTYEATWVEGSQAYAGSKAVCPCELDSRTRDAIMGAARKAYCALGCQDYARVDFRLRGDTAYILEVNPNPCIHPKGAGFVLACRAAGMDFPDMILTILEQSMQQANRLYAPVYKTLPVSERTARWMVWQSIEQQSKRLWKPS